jgi:hypothetical protein
MKTTSKRITVFARIRESWRLSGLEPGMPYAEYPFQKPAPPR